MDADSRIADTAAAGGGRERSVPGGLSHAAQVSLPIGRQGAQVAVPGRGNVARRAVYLPSLQRPGVARAVRRERTVKPSLVAYDLGEDGLYVARHVLGHGWLQIGKQRVRWRFAAPEIGP